MTTPDGFPIFILCAAHAFLFARGNIFHGERNYTVYYEGTSPIIFLSQHGGELTPETIPDRLDGCLNTTNDECIWDHSCEETTIYERNDSECLVKTVRDGNTKEIAECLAETVDIFGDNSSSNHLVINELHRSKLDPNRELGEATLYVNESIIAYNEIHYDFMPRAKNLSVSQCGFGLVFDIHGQAVNQFNQLAYRLSDSTLESSNSVINSASSSIDALRENNIQNATLSEIIKGNFSLGTVMNVTYGYTMVPSAVQPFLDGAYYYMGGFGLEEHGSRYGGNVDAIQIEVNADIRWDSTKRAQFCVDFSKAIEDFVAHFYDLSKCTRYHTTTTTNPTADPTKEPSFEPTSIPSTNPTITAPTNDPSVEITDDPTYYPTDDPTPFLTEFLSNFPTATPTEQIESIEDDSGAVFGIKVFGDGVMLLLVLFMMMN